MSEQLSMFEQQIEMMDAVFMKLVSTCHKKCIEPTYKDAELSKGESVCSDRCVSKYFDVLEKVSANLTQIGMAQQQPLK